MKTLILLSVLACALPAQATVWHVGATREFKAPSSVMALVANGDTVEIDAGLYVCDVGVWRADSLVLRCSQGLAHLDAQGTAANHKGIWVIDGRHTYVEGIEFSGAAVSANDGMNGTGIRHEGLGLEVRRCYFHDNQEAILTGNDTTNEILIQSCKFVNNGVDTHEPGLFQHQIYIGHSRLFQLKYCYFEGSIVGHEVKTRANRSYILYNKIIDGPGGTGSFSIDIPNGGLAIVIGNIIEKGPNTENSTAVTYGEEGIINPDSSFYFINNTVVTDRQPTTFINVASATRVAKVYNNIFAGHNRVLNGIADTSGNVISVDTSFFHFADVMAYDYHITSGFPGMIGSKSPGSVGAFSLEPVSEYVEPMDSMVRSETSAVGAFALTRGAGVEHHAESSNVFAYPNPFSSSTAIQFELQEQCDVLLEVFDMIGRKVQVMDLGLRAKGEHHLAWDASALVPGAYYAQLSTGNLRREIRLTKH